MGVQVINGDAIGQGVAALARAFLPTPEKDAHALYYASAAGLHQTRQAELQAGLDAREALGRAVQTAVASGITTDSLAHILAAGGRGGADMMRAIGSYVLALRSNTPGQTMEDITRAGLGAGQPMGHTPVGFKMGLDNDLERSRIAAGPGHAQAAAMLENYRNQEKRWRDERESALFPDGNGNLVPGFLRRGDTPGPGVQPVLGRNEALGTIIQNTGRPDAPPLTDTQRFLFAPGATVAGESAERRTEDTNAARVRAAEIKAGATTDAARIRADAAGNSRLPPNVTPKIASEMRAAIEKRVQEIHGAAPAPDLLNEMLAAAAADYQHTKNVVSGVDVAMERLGKELAYSGGVWGFGSKISGRKDGGEIHPGYRKPPPFTSNPAEAGAGAGTGAGAPPLAGAFQSGGQPLPPERTEGATPAPRQIKDPKEIADAIAAAKAAVRNGRDAVGVAARLRQFGIDPALAGLR